jgi:hypothetical protein
MDKGIGRVIEQEWEFIEEMERLIDSREEEEIFRIMIVNAILWW